MAPPNPLSVTIYEKVVAQPGIEQQALIDYALSKHPEATEPQARKAIENLVHVSKKSIHHGPRGDKTFHPNPEEKRATAPKVVAVKPAKYKAKINGNSKAKPKAPSGPFEVPSRVSVATTFDPEFSFAFGVRKDGGISIFKEGKTVSLSKSEIRTIVDHATV